MLFATVNPSSFANREVLSDAFMSRVTQIKLNNLTKDQLENILSTKIANTKLVSWLLSNYQLLNYQLQQHNSPIMLTLEDLLTLADDMQNVNEDEWSILFNKNFSLAIKSINFKSPTLLTNIDWSSSNTQQLSVNKNNSDIANTNLQPFIADDITNNNSYKTIIFFANYPDTTKYRLTLKKVVVDEDKIMIANQPIIAEDIVQIKPPLLSLEEEIQLQQGELLGTVTLDLTKTQWQLLPGISYHDECCGIHSEIPILVARSKNTGQLLIKPQENNHNEIVNINFIIKPSLIDINSVDATENLHPIVQNKYLTKLLDEHIFSQKALQYKSCRELQQIKTIADPKLKMQHLIMWAHSFRYNRNAISSGNNSFIEVIQQQIGTCFHRSVAFQVIAEYFGIPTNIISNDSHAFVEFSLDNKQSWITTDLGGAPRDLTEVEPTNVPKFSNYNDDIDVDFAIISSENSDDFFDNEGNVKPNKLIDFLMKKFPFKSHEQQMEHIYKNFNVYFRQNPDEIFANIIKVFVFWLKEANKRSSDILLEKAKKYIIPCILSMYEVYTSLVLPEDKNFSKSFKDIFVAIAALINELGLVALMLPLLEDLKLEDSCSENVIEILDNFYQQLAENKQTQIEYIQKNKTEYDLVYPKYIELSGHSKTLLARLKRVSLKKYWSYTNMGKSPNLTRLATKKPAFPFNQDAKNSQVATFIVASNSYNLQNELTKIFTDFINNQDNNAKIQQRYADYNGSIDIEKLSEKATTVVSSFIASVFQSCANDCTILFDDSTGIGDSFSTKLTAGHLQIDPNIYSFEEYATLYLNCNHLILEQKRSINSEPDIEMLRKKFHKSTGLLLNTDFLSSCFEEYLETINWSKLLK
jgi:hypothetical protein